MFIDKLVESSDRRFPPDDLDTVSALRKVFDVKRCPASSMDDNLDYDNEAVSVLSDKP